MKKFNVQGNLEKHLDVIGSILSSMDTNVNSKQRTGVLLSGDPGVGKTSFVKMFSRLMGLNLILIEAPHITEEHIINVPFISIDSETGVEKKGIAKVADKKYNVDLAQSNLYSLVTNQTRMSDAQYLKSVYTDKNISTLFEKLGGSKTTIPEEIKDIRSKLDVILFLDEYFRNDSPRIRNMLRGILNNKIGIHDIPKTTYVMYASNMNDEGLADIPKNNEFTQINFDAPDKDDWFAYLLNKFENDKKVKLNHNLIQKFYNILESEHLSNTDANADVRVSPRRWEQLLLYINATFPIKSTNEAALLLTNIESNFSNYQTGAKHELLNKVTKAVVELIKEESDIEVSHNLRKDNSDWRETIQHQIETKIKLGKHRHYIPVISGLPGIGKTHEMGMIADKMNMLYIYIDCSTLDPEDVTGIPVPEGRGKNTSIVFSEPKLYKQIMNDIETETANLSKDKVAAFKKNEYKYLIVFDELNRASKKVFNALRKVILEKEFAGDYKLPEASIVISAINPTDIGTEDLTSHMKDVTDMIPAEASWKGTKKFLMNIELPVPDKTKNFVLQAIDIFVEHFGLKTLPSDKRAFDIDIGGGDTIYVSPREYTAMYSQAVRNIHRKIKIIKPSDYDTDDKFQNIKNKILGFVADEFVKGLNFSFSKNSIDSSKFMVDLKNWFIHSNELDVDTVLTTKVKAETTDLRIMLKHFMENPKEDMSNEPEFINEIGNLSPHELNDKLSDFFTDMINSEANVVDSFVGNIKQTRKIEGMDTKEFWLDKVVMSNANKDSVEVQAKAKAKEYIQDFKNREISKIEHIIFELLHALKKANVSNDKIEVFFNSINDVMLHPKIIDLDSDSAEMTVINDVLSKVLTKLTHFI